MKWGAVNMMAKNWKLMVALAVSSMMAPLVGHGEMADGKWMVRPGDSLSKIVRQIAPDSSIDRNSLMQRIVAANPRAFKDANPNLMLAGVSLTIPDAGMSLPTSPTARVATMKAAPGQEPIVKPQEDGGAGIVTYTKGSVMSAGASGVRELSQGDSLANGETLSTGPGSYLRMRYSDGATMLVRPRSRIVIEEYQHTGDAQTDRSFLRLVKGGFRTVTGTIGKNNQDAYKVITPVATIGIRGTDYHTLFCQGDCVNIPDGLYTSTESGETVLTNGAGEQGVPQGQAGYVPLDGGRPVRLKIPPKVLKLPASECS